MFNFYVILRTESFHVDRLIRNSGANILAAATPHAYLRFDLRDGKHSFVGHHSYRLRGTMLGACTATRLVVIDDAVFDDQLHLSHLGVILLLFGEREDSTRGTHLATNEAIVITKPVIEVEPWLHHAAQAIFEESRLDHVRRALAHA